jgi:hypothetical protein
VMGGAVVRSDGHHTKGKAQVDEEEIHRLLPRKFTLRPLSVRWTTPCPLILIMTFEPLKQIRQRRAARVLDHVRRKKTKMRGRTDESSRYRPRLSWLHCSRADPTPGGPPLTDTRKPCSQTIRTAASICLAVS